MIPYVVILGAESGSLQERLGSFFEAAGVAQSTPQDVVPFGVVWSEANILLEVGRSIRTLSQFKQGLSEPHQSRGIFGLQT